MTHIAAGSRYTFGGAHDISSGGSHAGSNGFHAPPPVAVVGGQLWFGGEGISADDGLFHIDSDTAGRDVADLTTAHVSFENVGLDPASGFYFGISADGFLRDGHITNDQETNEASQIATTDMIFGSGVSADEVQALAVDPLNHIIFVGLWGQSDQYTGILEVRYDPTTGALTNPYNASTGVVTDFAHMLLHDDNTGKVNGVNFTNVIAMQYDLQNSNLYYVDQTNGTSISGGAGATWQATNGIYVVGTTGTVGGGTEPTPTLLTLNSQFAAGDNNNYIEGLAINEAQGIIYFCASNASTSTSKLYYMSISGGTATQIVLPSSFFADNNLAGVNSIAFDPNQRQLYISDDAHSKIIQVTLDAAGHVASSTNMTWMDFDSGVGGSSSTGLFFDPLPTLSSLTGTSTEALQGGSALQLLTANPASITDPQDGATNKLHMGYMQITIANAQTGDNLFYNGLQSGTFDSGKMSINWNSSTHTLTLTGNETEAFYASLFTSISYQDSGTDNSVGSHPTRTIDWIISDGTTIVDQTTADSNEQSTTVVIDRAPTLAADNYPVVEATSVTGTSGTGGTGVLGNDNDKDGDAIVVTAVNGSGANVGNSVAGTYGHLTLNANGSYSYLADNAAAIAAAATGSHPVDTFTYTVSDGLGGVTTTTVSFTIDRIPTVVADNPSGQALESGSAITGNVLTNDSDRDGDTLTVSQVNGSGANVGNSVAGTYGHMTINSNGTYSYTADNTAAIDAAATGSHLTDTFTYTASDGHGGTTTTTITATIDRAPTVVSDNGGSDAVESGSAVTGNVLTNDSDRDGDTLSVSAVAGSGANVGNSVASTYGHFNIGSNGAYSYSADNTAAIDGAATGSHLTDSVTYTASDGHGGTTTTTLTVTIDRAPTVVADTNPTQAVESGSAVTGNVLTNDSDRDGDTLSVSAVAGSGANVGNSTATTYGHFTINANGTYSYTADNTAAIDAAATGSHLTDSVTYTADDGHGGTTTTTLTITIDRAPTVVADNPAGEALESGSAVTGNVLTNDSDRDGDTLSVSAVNGSAGNVGNSVAGTYGHMTINANGTYSYTADNTAAIDAAATGAHLTDSFTYQASDGHGGTTTTTLTITLDRAPTVVADNPSGQAIEGGTDATGNVLTNDSDRDGDTLVVSAVAGSGANVGNSVAGTYGHITINSNGTFDYTADKTSAIDSAPTGSHLTDTFTYTASDGLGGTSTTSITITLDRGPTAVADTNSATEGGSVSKNAATGVLSNDSDRDGDTLVISAVGGSAANVGTSFATTYGHITLNADGSYNYLADNTTAIDAAPTGSHPLDVITFTVSDGFGGTINETLSITLDRPASATADSLNTAENAQATVGSGSPINANLLANDADPDGDSFSITAVNGSGANVGTQITLASGALLTVNADGTYTYDPNHAFDWLAGAGSGASDTSATDTFTYTITGGATVTVTITINGLDSNDVLIGTSGNDTINGGIGDDIFYDDNGLRSGQDPHDTSAGKSGGIDSFSGGSGNDFFYMGGNLTAADQIDGGANTDHVVLNGNYAGGLTFNSTTMVNVEFLTLTAGHSYTLVMDNATVAFGQTLRVQAGTLGAGDTLTFDASNDTTGGNYVITAGAGNDVLTGGNGDDHFIVGSGGHDTVHGGGGDDTINAGAALTAADVFDGGSGTDNLYLKGDYSSGVVFNATTMTNIESITLVAGHDYNLTMNAANVTSGQTLTVHAASLLASDNVTFNASAGVAGSSFVFDTGAGNDILTGGAGNDIFRPGAGNDTVHGGGGDDVINMSASLTAADSIDGGSGTDTLELNGDYSAGITFGATTLTNFEAIYLTPGNDYKLTTNDATVAAGQTLTILAQGLHAGDTLVFDGSAETNGSFIIHAGAGNDTITGGHGADTINAGNGSNTITAGLGGDDITGGTGNDLFVYNAVAESTSSSHDRVHGFDASNDHFQFTGVAVNAIDTAITTGHLQIGNFDANLAAAVNGSNLAAHDAVLFTADSGNLAGHTYLVVDVNGTAGYQAGQDFVIDITGATNLGSLTTANFLS